MSIQWMRGCGVAGLITAGFAAAPALAGTPDPGAVADSLNLTDVQVFSMAADKTPGQPVSVEVLIGDDVVGLDLQPHSVRAPGYQVYTTGADGRTIPVKAGPIKTLKGVTSRGGTVRGAMHDDGLYARIRTADGDMYWLEPLSERMPEVDPDVYAIYHQDAIISSGGVCGTEHPPIGAAIDDVDISVGGVDPEAAQAQASPEGVDVFQIAELACDTDYEYFLTWGAGTEDRVNLVINLVNDQYETETGITHVITAIVIRDNPNDPYSSFNAGGLLNQFQQEWLQNQGGIPRDVAHLFTGKNLNGGTIGIAANIGVICSNQAFCLSQSDCCCCPSLGCSTDLTAHELGHLWGAFHCSCQFPPKTMNPFILCANTFSNGSINSIVNEANSVSCLDIGNPNFPANDECDNAINITPGTFEFTSINATTDGPVEFGPCATLQNDIWYRLGATETGIATVDFCNANYDTVLAVYEGFCPTGPAQLDACNDDFDCDDDGSANDNIQSRLVFPVEQGVLYTLRVGGFQGATGFGEFTFSIEPVAPPPPPCPTDLNGDGTTGSADLNLVLAAFGESDAGDVNDDGLTNSEDLNAVLAEFGLDCE